MVFKPTFPAKARPFLLLQGLLAAVLLSGQVFAQDPVEDPAGSEETTEPAASQDAAEPVLVGIPDRVKPLTLQQEVTLSQGSRVHLSLALSRATRRLLARANPELIHVRLAFEFARLATELDKDSVASWRLLLAIAGASDPGDPVVQAAELESLIQISRLDPDDDVVRLRRLLLVIEQAQTVEERLARFEKLLEPDSIELIGRPVAARLALDMALLYSRTGDLEAFARRLAQSLDLDPSYPRATAMAAGYFGQGDPVAESELLVAALLADPTEVGFASQLGSLALAHGAYGGADRMLEIAQYITRDSGQPSDELTLQRALALWGSGRAKEALSVIASHMRDLDAIVRTQARKDNPSLDPSDVIEFRATEPPRLSLIKAAILSEDADTQSYREYVAKVMKNLLKVIDEQVDSDADSELPANLEQATVLLEAAAFAAWQAEDPDMIESFVSAARERIDLTPEAVGRFEAWSAISRGRTELAMEILSYMEEDDELAALALSIAYVRTDQLSSAARIWLRLARESPGTVIGIWARNRLKESLGSSLSPSETAQKIDRHIAEIPVAFDRLLLQRDAAYSLRLTPVNATVGPFKPVLYNLEIANRSAIRLSIGNEGPLLPTAALMCSTTAAGGGGSSRDNLMVLSIDRRLAIEPRESMTIGIDLVSYPVGEITVARAGEGFSVDARAVTNFASDGQMVVPALFGEKATARLLRIDGVTPDKPFRRDTLALVDQMESVEALDGLLLLVQVALRTGGADVGPEAVRFRERIFKIFMLQYAQLPSAARAWLAYAVPDSSSVPGYDEISRMILADQDQLVQSVLLAKLTWSARDGGTRNPILLQLMDSENPEVASMANDMMEVWDIAEVEENKAILSN